MKKQPKQNFIYLTQPPKYRVGDLVLKGKALVVKIHDKADYDKAFYRVHNIQDGTEEWVPEFVIETTEQPSSEENL